MMETIRRNAEGYPDPTAGDAVQKIIREERRAVRQSFRPLAYICSPFRGAEERNKEKARGYCRFAVDSGYIPLSTILLFPQFMDDSDPDERNTAIFMDLVLLGKCHEVWVFGERISKGMSVEIARAKKTGQTIRYFTEEMEEMRHA